MKSADAASSYASQTLPTLQQHLETAQSLAKGGASRAKTSSRTMAVQ
jgi:hypothetical protein